MTRHNWNFVFMSALALLLTGVICAAPRATGMGLLTAKGDGEVHVQLIQGRVIIKGEGRLEAPKAARVNFSRRQDEPRTKRICRNGDQYDLEIYRRFSGTATITGEMTHIVFRGKAEIVIAGAAGALLIGDGAYSVNNRGNKDDDKGKWSNRAECKTCADDHKVTKDCVKCEREYNRRDRAENDRNQFQRDMIQVGDWELAREKDNKRNDDQRGNGNGNRNDRNNDQGNDRNNGRNDRNDQQNNDRNDHRGDNNRD